MFELSRRPTRSILAVAYVAAMLTALPAAVDAQYFGRNKVQYETFDFRVLESPHFDAHFYPAESLAAADAARMAERWYSRFSPLLQHTFKRRPLVFYANHPDFQQTNVIGGMISEGTGGVTESARQRVILPFTGVYADNDHVLGHEIVHVFQYDIADSMARVKPDSLGNRGSGRGLQELPLWFIEGMAEYLSVGRSDPHTAMWLRDAVLRDKLPTIKQLTTDGRFFPYRYGEALWAYIGGKWGDQKVNVLYRAALHDGIEPAIRKTLGITHDSLSKEWHAAIRTAYTPLMEGMARPEAAGERLLPRERKMAGMMEVSPALSPDGRYVAFLSSRNLVSIDLVVAEVATGRIVKNLTTPNGDNHFSSLSFISAAGSWSPDAKQLAYVTTADGDNQIALFDVEREKVIRQFALPDIEGINDAAWGPNGQIAFTGMKGGISDLYLLDPATGKTRQLTDDRFAELQPAWSPDGKVLAFATDRGAATSFEKLSYGKMRLASLDIATATVALLPSFEGAKNINPQFSPDGGDLFFISDRDGFSNVYRLAIRDNLIFQVTRLATGVSGITALSPALAVASKNGSMAFSVFHDASQLLYSLGGDQTRGTIVESAVSENGIDHVAVSAIAGMLPPANPIGGSRVASYLSDDATVLFPGDSLTVRPLSSKLGLEYLGAPTIGISGGGGFGTAVGGSMQAFFTDMLNNHIVGATLYSEGGIRGLGAETFYLNQKKRLNWGVGVSHVPYMLGVGQGISDTTIGGGRGGQQGIVYEQQLVRLYMDQAALTTRYPLSQTRRFEAGLSLNRQSYGVESYRTVVVGNQVVGQDRVNVDGLPSVKFAQASFAYVGDYSSFGFTSPIAGARYRLEVSPMVGDLTFGTLLADYRRYFFLKPVTLAFRGLHYGRYGKDAENSEWMQPLFVGYNSYVRGYAPETFSSGECTASSGSTGCAEFDRMLGSRIGVASAEMRIPLLGPRELAIIPFFLPVEVAPFVDAGLAWSSTVSPSFSSSSPTAHTPVFSAGVSTRINMFGALIVDVFYAHPFQRPLKGGFWGFQLAPGW